MQKIVSPRRARLGVCRPATRLATKINTATIEPETPEEEVVAEVAAPRRRAPGPSSRTCAGITGPFGFFDPPLSAGKSEQRLKYFREAELKHARVAMLAAAGFLVAENFHPLFGGAIDVPSYVAYQQTPLQTFWPVVVLYVGIVEIFSVFTFESPFEGNL
ncbi:chlorophyll A-B binding protein [Aureococcus anophagefferens]|nr:chlorophyll A-B binding protein [Aureococcus anophagefferens]